MQGYKHTYTQEEQESQEHTTKEIRLLIVPSIKDVVAPNWAYVHAWGKKTPNQQKSDLVVLVLFTHIITITWQQKYIGIHACPSNYLLYSQKVHLTKEFRVPCNFITRVF